MTKEDRIIEFKQARDNINITIKRLTKEVKYYEDVLEKININLEKLENEDKLE